MSTFRELFGAVQGAEEELAALYRVAMDLHRHGGLSEGVRTLVHAARDETYALDQAVYRTLTSTLPVLVPVGGGVLASQVPRPHRTTDLPPANVGHPPPPTPGAQALIGPHVKSGLWAAGILVVLAAIAAGAYILGQGVEEAGLLAREALRIRENTRRYRLQLLEVAQRFTACLEAGGSHAACAAAHPVTPPPIEPGAPGPSTGGIPWGWLAAGAAVAVVAIGGLFYLAYRVRAAQAPTLRLAGGRGALPSGYRMEVAE